MLTANFIVWQPKKKKKKVVGEEPKINIENRDIERVYKTKILWVGVITLIILLIEFQKNNGIIVKVKNILNLKTTKNLYYSFIYPYLNYCCCVWGLACITYSSKLHIIQKRIAKLILGKQNTVLLMDYSKN